MFGEMQEYSLPFERLLLDEAPTSTRSPNELENEIHQELDCDNPSNSKFRRQYSHGGAHSLNVPGSVRATPMHIMVTLPDGRIVPVQFPVIASSPVTTVPVATSFPGTSNFPAQNPTHVDSSVVIPVSRPTQNVTSTGSQVSILSESELKLREIHAMKYKMGYKRFGVKTQILSKASSTPQLHETSSDEIKKTTPSLPSKYRHQRRKCRETDEEKKKSLERHRAANLKCRLRREQLLEQQFTIDTLERKRNEEIDANIQLKDEVSLLRKEVAHLKSILVAHEGCHGTLMQKISCKSESNLYDTPVTTSKPSSANSKQVPDSSVVQPLNSSEFMKLSLKVDDTHVTTSELSSANSKQVPDSSVVQPLNSSEFMKLNLKVDDTPVTTSKLSSANSKQVPDSLVMQPLNSSEFMKLNLKKRKKLRCVIS